MKNYQVIFSVLCLFCLGEVSVGQAIADQRPTEEQLEASIFEALTLPEDDWFKATSSLKNEAPDSFDRVLSNILKNHLQFRTQSEDGRSRYAGISELKIKRAIEYCLRDNFASHAAASAIANIMSLEEEGKIPANQSNLLLELLFQYDGFSETGALAIVTEKYDASARSKILNEVARRYSGDLLSKELSILFLKRAYAKEKDPTVLNQLNQLYMKLGAPSKEQE